MSGSSPQTVSSKPKKSFDIAVVCAICGVLFSALIFLFMLKQERETAIQQFYVDTSQTTFELERLLTTSKHEFESLHAHLTTLDEVTPESLQQAVSAFISAPQSTGLYFWQAADGSSVSIGQVDSSVAQTFNNGLSELANQQQLTNGYHFMSEGGQPLLLFSVYEPSSRFIQSGAGNNTESQTGLIAGINPKALMSQLSAYSKQTNAYEVSADNNVIISIGELNAAAQDTLVTNALAVPESWTVRAAASEGYLSAQLTYIPVLFLFTGILLSILFASYIRKMTARLHQLKNQFEQTSQQLAVSITHELQTGVAKKAYFDEMLITECRRAVREFSPLTVMLLELDNFETIAHHEGQPFADDVKKNVAIALKSLVSRPGDIVAYYDENTFALMLPSTNEMVTELAEQCRAGIEALNIGSNSLKQSVTLTLSIGVATAQPSRLLTPEYIIDLANQQLQQAKASGGNQFNAYSEPSNEPPVTYSV